MNDVFTVVSLVVGVSGGTFMGIAAVRDLLRGRISRAKEDAQSYVSQLERKDDPAPEPTCRQARSDFRRLGKAYVCWNIFTCLPALFFLVFIFFLTFHVCWSCWTPSAADASRAPCATEWWDSYKGWILGLAIADLLCVLAVCLVVPILLFYASLVHRTFSAHSGKGVGSRPIDDGRSLAPVRQLGGGPPDA